MSEQMEKLVEEIYLGLSAVSWGFQPKDAEELITRIGKAYTDGELELPGEVERGEMVLVTKSTADYREVLSYWGVLMKHEGSPPRYIAFAKRRRNDSL